MLDYKKLLNKYKKIVIIILIQTISISSVFSGERIFNRLTIEDGLSQSSIHSIYQDSFGYIWFGTYDGLNVYDGYDFYVFSHNSSNPESLSNNNIYPIFEDSQGILWIGTGGGGLNKFNRENNSFTSFRFDSTIKNSISNDTVYSIYEDSYGILWIGTRDGGLNIFNRNDNTFTNYRNVSDISAFLFNKVIYVIFEDSKRKLWIGTDDGLYKYNRESGSFIEYKHNPDDKKSISDNVILSIFEDSDKNLWIGTGYGGLNKYITGNNSFIHFKYDPENEKTISHDQIRSINEDNGNNLWIATNNGLNLLDKDSNSFIRYKNNPVNHKSLNNNLVRSLYKDRSGILWVGTLDGITSINPEYKKIHTYINRTDDKNSISHNYIRSVYENSRKEIWIGTRGGGLNRYNPMEKSFIHFEHDPKKPDSISSNNITGICEDDNGNLWVGTSYDGLNKYVPEEGVFKRYNMSENGISISSNEISVLLKDSRGYIWIGTEYGLNRLDPGTDSFSYFNYNLLEPVSISDNSITALFEDSKKNIWIGTNKGLNKFDVIKNTITTYYHDPEDIGSLNDNKISSIAEDLSGNLWIGTISSGLNKLNIDTLKFAHYTLNEGLVNEYIYGILVDNSGNIWFSTNQGISKLDPLTNEIKNYDVNDGLQSNEFNSNVCFKTGNGEFFFGGVHGLNSFYPENIIDNPVIPPLVVTSFNFGGKSIDFNVKDISEHDLNWKHNFFELEFSALNYISSKKNQYSYKLEGFEEQWNNSNKRRFVSYTNLPGGNYTLRIRGSNNDNQWNSEGLSINVRVSSPPWKRWWAYCIYLIIVVIVIRFILEHQKHSIFRQFTINIAHEIKTPLTLVTNYMDRYIKNHPFDQDLGIIQKNLEKLKKNMINFFNAEAFKMGKIVYHHDHILSLSISVNEKILIFKDLFSAKNITLEHEIADEELYIQIDPLALDEILNNLLENSIKYNKPSGMVFIQLYKEKDSIVLTVKDSGIGISKKNQRYIFNSYYQVSHGKSNIQGVGLGLFITKQIVNQIDGKISIESEENKGSSFKIIFPRYKIDSEFQEIKYKENKANDNLPEKKEPYPLLEVQLRQEIYDESKNTLFIVEDNMELLAYLQGELLPDYNIFYGLNGKEALLKIVDSPKPDIIISDIMMDTMDGYEFYDKLIKYDKFHSVPFIFLTAKTGIDNQLIGLKKGAVDFIEKPFSIELLKEKISSLIDIQLSKELDVLENIDQYKKKVIVELFKKYHIIPSEQELIIQALKGLENKQISSQLDLQYNTVKTYFYRIYKKCNVKNRVELVKLFNPSLYQDTSCVT